MKTVAYDLNLNHKNGRLWIASAAIAFLFCYAKTIASHIEVWRQSYIYSYGFLVPFVSLYLIWDRRHLLKSVRPAPEPVAGACAIFAGLFLLLSGRNAGIISLQGISLVLSLAGLTLFLMGRRFLRQVSFPIGYLLFMVPFWDRLTEQLHMPLQIFSARNAASILQILGLPVHVNATYLALPNITLEVARECSGVNNLIAVVAVAIPLSYLVLRSWIRRITLICAGIGIAVLGNSARVALIGLLAYYNAAGDFHGPYHILQAMLVTIIGYIILLSGAWLLSRRERHAPHKRGEIAPSAPGHLSEPTTCQTPKLPVFILSIVLFVLGIFVNFRM